MNPNDDIFKNVNQMIQQLLGSIQTEEEREPPVEPIIIYEKIDKLIQEGIKLKLIKGECLK